MPTRALALFAVLASLLALLGYRHRGTLAARINRPRERARVLALLNTRPDVGELPAGMRVALWRIQKAKANGADPRIKHRSHP